MDNLKRVCLSGKGGDWHVSFMVDDHRAIQTTLCGRDFLRHTATGHAGFPVNRSSDITCKDCKVRMLAIHKLFTR